MLPQAGLRFAGLAEDRLFVRRIRIRIQQIAAPRGNILDRTGQPIEVPVAVNERTDGGQRWLVAEITLAPLTNGDYVVELAATGEGKTEKAVVGIRVIR